MSDSDFHVDLLAFAQKTGDNIETLVREVVIDVGARIVERSPVGNPSLWQGAAPPGYAGGRFRANWQYSFGASTTEPIDKVDATGAASNQRIIAGVRASPAFGQHFISNNLPYAMRLEEGHSTQAPNGMVMLAVAEFQQIIRDQVAAL